jgi:hypothetical protein
MNQSSVITGGVTLSAASLAPLVKWALTGFTLPPPEGTDFLIAAFVLTVGHAVYNLIAARVKTDQTTPESKA